MESGPVTADITTTVVHSYTLLINDVKPVHPLTLKLNRIQIILYMISNSVQIVLSQKSLRIYSIFTVS